MAFQPPSYQSQYTQSPQYTSIQDYPSPQTPLIRTHESMSIYEEHSSYKKKRNILRIVGLIICALLGLALFAFVGVAIGYTVTCSIGAYKKLDIYTVHGKDIQSLEIVNQLGSIDIDHSEYQTDNITITVLRKAGRKNYLDDFSRKFSTDDGNIILHERVTRDTPWSWLSRCKHSEITVKLPSSFSKRPNLHLVSVDGFLSLTNTISMSSIFLENFNGRTLLKNVEADRFRADTSNGFFQARGQLNSTDMDIQMNNGWIDIKGDINIQETKEGNEGYLSVSSTNGRVMLGDLYCHIPSHIDIKSSNGLIHLDAPQYHGSFVIQSVRGYSKVHGEVKYEIDQESYKKGYAYGTGKNSTLSVKTSNGNVGVDFS